MHFKDTQTFWRIMKLTGVLLLIALLHVSAKGLSQKVTLAVKNAPLEKVFDQIKQQTGLSFLWDEQVLAKTVPVTLDVKDAPVSEVLDICLKNQGLSYSMIQNMVVIKKTTAGLQPADSLKPPQILLDIHGSVTDSLGNPLAGASVTVKGNRKGTITDANGNFTLTGINDNAIILISFTGYETRQIALASNPGLKSGVDISGNPFSLTLKRSTSPLDEVQIIAYGTTTRRLNTGNVSTVSSKEIEEQPVSNPLAALEGRVPGLIITQQTGVPGGGYTVQIRGQNSIANGNDPLYLIDGVPYTSQLLPNLGGSIIGSGNPLNYINPMDIESVDVLKDADATAIYGSRGANGVVLINTKKGKANNTEINLNISSGYGKISRYMSLMNPQQYLSMRHEAFANDSTSPQFNDYDVNGTWDSTRSTGWQKFLLGGTSNYTNIDASVSGGNTNTQYIIGSGYFKETTVFPGNSGDQKGSLHFGINNVSNNQKFKVSLTGNYVVDKNDLFYADLAASTTLPWDAPPIFNKDGTLNWANGEWINPLSYELQKYNSSTYNLVSNSVLQYEILRGLEIKANLGYTNMQVNEISISPITVNQPAYNINTGSAGFINNNIRSWIIEPQIDYHTKISKGKLTTLIGTTIQENTSQSQSLNAAGYTSDALLETIQGASTITGNANYSDYKYEAIFGRLNYNWEDKYLLDLTARRDGSSRFGPGKQFANFGAFGIGWIFSKEKIISQNLGFLSFGKLRASLGTTGNDQIGNYGYLSLFNSTYYSYQNTQGLYPNNLFNSDFAWEINKKIEFAIDLGFFKERILLNTSYYNNRSSNQLVPYTLPSITGFISVTENLPAVVQNSGLEISLNTINIKSKNFSWISTLLLTVPRNKLVSFPNFSSSSYFYSYVIGEPLSVHKVYHMLGVDPQAGVYLFADSKGKPTFNPDYINDRTTNVNIDPKFYGGFQNGLQYKNVRLDIFFQFTKQLGRNNLFNNYAAPGMTSFYNQPETVWRRWQKPGDIAPIEKFTTSFGSNAFTAYNYAQSSDYAYSDASFIRLKNISISYELHRNIVSALHLKSFRVFLQAQNLLTITHYQGSDPENQNALATPPLRVITGGIQVIF